MSLTHKKKNPIATLLFCLFRQYLPIGWDYWLMFQVSVSGSCLLWHFTGDIWHLPPEMWHLTHGTWHITPDMWHMKHDKWHLTPYNLHMTPDKLAIVALDVAFSDISDISEVRHDTWQVKPDTYNVTRDIWHMTFDTWNLTKGWYWLKLLDLLTWDRWYMTSEIWHLTCYIWHLTPDSWHLTQAINYTWFGGGWWLCLCLFWHLTCDTRHRKSDTQHGIRDRWQVKPDT